MKLSPREIRLIDFALCFVAANLLDDSATDSLFTENQSEDELSEELHALAQRIQQGNQEQIALEKYVDAVGGWERAKTVIEQCLKQKF